MEGYAAVGDPRSGWRAVDAASQVLIHRIVSVEQLPSAVRINATGRYLGFLVGPIVGDGLLQIFGSSYGIFINGSSMFPCSSG